ncbi:IS1096 element passenger TnpR family protein [Clostridium grantii]|uniref:PRiA4b ORF-3-like protein n=1 Tax=Clostridium grantii DSM 8605 TaxID=1121316 RepID=A0A1M5Y5N0_9CLOT|nr:hypothetical protein [Clostridium grantii]SHI07219.1 pRiA4b ORF-3-like protein [Clostridium grantii DSM 8605]
MATYNIDNKKTRIFLEDFNTFTHYLNNKVVTIGKSTKNISSKFLYEMNGLMHVKQQNITEKSKQSSYPMLHLFCKLAVEGNLFKEESIKGSKLALKSTDRLKTFNEFNDIEKYMFLLETFWIDCDMRKTQCILYDYMDVSIVTRNVEYLSTQKSNEDIFTNNLPYLSSSTLLCFTYFGLMTIEANMDEMIKDARRFIPSKIVINDLGLKIFKILNKKRNLELWNIPHRKNYGEWKVNFDEAFIHVFKSLFKKGELEQTFSRNKEEFKDGTYTFKVSLDKNTWAKIKISAHHDLDYLHECIQDAFEFDNDHMYSFFMDGKAWSNNKFTCPMDYEGPWANDVNLGELNLFKKQKFLYLFDYGDEWWFTVEVFDIEDSNTRLLIPEIIEFKGEPPEQYPDFDDEC